MRTDRAVAILLGKELRAEWRSRELLQTTLIFALIVVVLFSFAFDPTAAESRRFGPGLLWIAFLFAGTLMLNPSFAREQANDTLQALRMAPISAFALLLGKILANFLFLLTAELVLLPVFAVLYNIGILPVIGRLLLVIVLGTLGVVVTGTVFAALASQARMRELLLPLLLLPVLAPLNDEPALDPTWTVFLAAFDVVFLTASWLLCEHLMEG
jgi:heme exporter protein B